MNYGLAPSASNTQAIVLANPHQQATQHVEIKGQGFRYFPIVQKKGVGVQLKNGNRSLDAHDNSCSEPPKLERAFCQTNWSESVDIPKNDGHQVRRVAYIVKQTLRGPRLVAVIRHHISLISRSTSTLHLVASSIIGIGPLVKSGVEYEASGYRLPDPNSHSICASLFPAHCGTEGRCPLAPGLSVQYQFSTSSVPVQTPVLLARILQVPEVKILIDFPG